MDDAPTAVAPQARFAPDRRFTVLAAVGAVGAALVALVAGTGPGGVLALTAAAVLGCYAVGDLVFSPRLVVDGTGLRIRTPLARATLAWDDVEQVRADTRLRLGLRSTTLEIDAGEVLVVLSRRALGADPDAAADLVNAFRPI